MAKSTDEMLNKIDTKLDDVSDSIHRVDKELALQKVAFEDHTKQDERMYEEFKRMNNILQDNTDSLREHMHRTDLLEQLVRKMDSRLAPIEVARLKAATINEYRNAKLLKIGKWLAIISTIIGIIVAAQPFLIKLLLL